MKVLFVFSIGKTGSSVAGVWLRLLDALPAHGVEPFVVIPKDDDGSMVAELKCRNIPWCEAFFTWWVTSDEHPRSLSHRIRRSGAKIVNRAADKVIGDFIEHNGIELVYICDGTITAGLKEAKRRGIPVVWHLHQFVRDAESGASFIDPEAHVGATFAKADAIITATKSIKTYLRSRFPLCRNVYAIYNGVSKQRVFDKRDVLAADSVVFTFAGGLDVEKHPYDAMQAFSRVALEFPEARLRFVGTGKGEDISHMRHEADISGVASQIEFLGAREDMAGIWRDTDVALNCCLSEGSSMSMEEAMVSGCLLLCSTAEGNVELINGKYGLLYERGNVDALEGQMRWVLEHRSEARALACAGKHFAASELSVEHQADKVYQVFSEVCGSECATARTKAFVPA